MRQRVESKSACKRERKEGNVFVSARVCEIEIVGEREFSV